MPAGIRARVTHACEWESDVGRRHDLARQGAQRLTDLPAEHDAAHLAHHRQQRSGHVGQRPDDSPSLSRSAPGGKPGSPSPARPPAPARPPVSSPLNASTTLLATGSTSSVQVGRVASIHSARLHALADVVAAGKDVVGSSQSSASRIASVDRASFGRPDRWVVTCRCLPRDVLGQIPVHRAALPRQHVGEPVQSAADVGATEIAEAHAATPHRVCRGRQSRDR